MLPCASHERQGISFGSRIASARDANPKARRTLLTIHRTCIFASQGRSSRQTTAGLRYTMATCFMYARPEHSLTRASSSTGTTGLWSSTSPSPSRTSIRMPRPARYTDGTSGGRQRFLGGGKHTKAQRDQALQNGYATARSKALRQAHADMRQISRSELGFAASPSRRVVSVGGGGSLESLAFQPLVRAREKY